MTLELQNFRTSPSRCGWWVDVSADALAGALKEAMALTDDERQVMGENGRRLVERKYRWETVAKQMERVYQEILEKKV